VGSNKYQVPTNMNKKGVDLSVIQRTLGHSEPSLEYIDVLPEQLTQAAELAF